MWKRIGAAGIIAVTLGVTVAGNLHFKDKIQAATNNMKTVLQDAVPGGQQQDSSYTEYMKNLPEAVQTKIKQAIETKKPLQLVIAGDEAVTGWPDILTKNLQDTYGPGVFQVTVKSYPQKTTQQWVDEQIFEDIAHSKPDIVLYEPSLLVDAGVVGKQKSMSNISVILDEITKSVPGVAIFVQPPNPLHQAKNYPITIQLLKDSMESKGITYLDHWQNWPDPNGDDIVNYLEKSDGWANSEGQQVWAQYLTNYFTGDQKE